MSKQRLKRGAAPAAKDELQAVDKPVRGWQKLAAVVVLALVAACVVIFRHRLGSDFLPLDASRVGPNLVAAAIQAAVIFCLLVLFWPPWQRRLHRFVDRKLAPLHERVEELHHRHDAHAASLERLHAKLDALAPPTPTRREASKPKPRPRAKPKPKERP